MEQRTPKHIVLFPDGNRRWAKEKGIDSLEGHKIGYDNLVSFCEWCKKKGVYTVTAFGFSTENWNREEDEVSYLMGLLRDMTVNGLKELTKENVRICFIGTRDRLSSDILKVMELVEKESAGNSFTMWVCLSYGGRAEITAAAAAQLPRACPLQRILYTHIFGAPRCRILILLFVPAGRKDFPTFFSGRLLTASFFSPIRSGQTFQKKSSIRFLQNSHSANAAAGNKRK